jgi:hypothetical protein
MVAERQRSTADQGVLRGGERSRKIGFISIHGKRPGKKAIDHAKYVSPMNRFTRPSF